MRLSWPRFVKKRKMLLRRFKLRRKQSKRPSLNLKRSQKLRNPSLRSLKRRLKIQKRNLRKKSKRSLILRLRESLVLFQQCLAVARIVIGLSSRMTSKNSS